MPNDLTISTAKPAPGLPRTLSDDALERAIAGQCDQERVLRQVRDLMRCYWQPNETPEERVRFEALLVKDLSAYSDWVVASAIEEWRRTMAKRPSPAELRASCARFRQNAQVQLTARRDDRGPDPETHRAGHSSVVSEVAKASFRRIASSIGYVEQDGDWITQAHRDDREEQAPRVPHWSEREETATLWASALDKARSANPLMRDLSFRKSEEDAA